MRKASTPPSFPLPASSPFSTLKQTSLKKKKIIKCHHCLQSFVRYQEQQVDVAQCWLWPPVNTFSPSPFPSPSGCHPPFQGPPPSPGKPWIDTCLAQSGLSPTAGIWCSVKAFDWELRQLPSPEVLCQAGHTVSPCTNQEALCTGTHVKTQSL